MVNWASGLMEKSRNWAQEDFVAFEYEEMNFKENLKTVIF